MYIVAYYYILLIICLIIVDVNNLKKYARPIGQNQFTISVKYFVAGCVNNPFNVSLDRPCVSFFKEVVNPLSLVLLLSVLTFSSNHDRKFSADRAERDIALFFFNKAESF